MRRVRLPIGPVLSPAVRVLVQSTAAAILTALILICAVGIVPHHGARMDPSIRDGDLVLTLKRGCAYRAGTVCAFIGPDGRIRLGRIAAGPGDEVSFTAEGELEVNGIAMEVSKVSSGRPTVPDDNSSGSVSDADRTEGIRFPYSVPGDAYFILNDNREQTDDSRTFGAVERRRMRGEAFWLFRRRGF